MLDVIDVVESYIGARTKIVRKGRNYLKRLLCDDYLRMDPRDGGIVCAIRGSSAVRVAAYTASQCRGRLSRDSDKYREEANAQSRLLRDVFGNPFHPVAFSNMWRSPPVVALATKMYESRSFDEMPILANALEEAGCANSAVLAHCRDPEGGHIRGCWVTDLVLRKDPGVEPQDGIRELRQSKRY